MGVIERIPYEYVLHTESTAAAFIKTGNHTRADDKFIIPPVNSGSFSILISQILNERGKVDTVVDYEVAVIFFWSDGLVSKKETVGTYLNSTGILRVNEFNSESDDFLPHWFQIELKPSAATPSDVRVSVIIDT